MSNRNNKILILGATGMLGNAVFRYFHGSDNFSAVGSIRSSVPPDTWSTALCSDVVCNIDVEDEINLRNLFRFVNPDTVVNCVGLVKQLVNSKDPVIAITINSLLPHRLAKLCDEWDARLIHVSTDCVFDGKRGLYREEDASDAKDLYGKSKYLGEVDYPNAVTLRTSIIGHEINGGHSLVNWFLAQEGTAKGFNRAVFSGLPTVELARVIRDYVIPNVKLRGVYHVSSDSINKFDLLKLVATIYEKNIEIIAEDNLVIDRSLDSSRFRQITGYKSPAWTDLVRSMRLFA